jgi:hypothetical protein
MPAGARVAPATAERTGRVELPGDAEAVVQPADPRADAVVVERHAHERSLQPAPPTWGLCATPGYRWHRPTSSRPRCTRWTSGDVSCAASRRATRGSGRRAAPGGGPRCICGSRLTTNGAGRRTQNVGRNRRSREPRAAENQRLLRARLPAATHASRSRGRGARAWRARGGACGGGWPAADHEARVRARAGARTTLTPRARGTGARRLP